MNKLRGVIVPVAVPIRTENDVDDPALERLVEFLIGSGAHGLFANGSMGGFAFLTDRMQIDVIEKVTRLAANRVPVLAGASDTSTVRVLEKIRAVQQLPVDAMVVLPPYYYIYQQADLLRFFLSVADHSQKPIVLYDNPRLVSNSLSIETIVSLAQHPNIQGLKYSTTDVYRWQQLLNAPISRDRFSLISGAGRMSALALQLGFDGLTEGLHNIVPGLACEIFQAAQAGDASKANELQLKMNAAFKILDVAGGWRGLELSMQYMGIASKSAFHPFDEPVSNANRDKILAALEQSQVPRPYPSLLEASASFAA